MTLRPLSEHHLEFLSLKGGCTGSSESTLVKIPHFWKSRVAAHVYLTMVLDFKVMVQSETFVVIYER